MRKINLGKLAYTKSNILRGALIYSSGDLIAAVLLGEFSIIRLLGMMLLGATLYAFEIPNYFAWIERKTKVINGIKKTLTKTALAIVYFNPLWIARHIFFIKLFSGDFGALNLNLLTIGFLSFLVNIPVSFLANFLIQNKVPLDWRFLASAIFSALMAIYYALSEVIFS